MKKIAILVTICSLLAFPILSADGETLAESYFRIDELKSEFQTAYKTFVSADGKTTVQLIAVDQKGLPGYYETIEKMMANKVVLYECVDCDLEENRKMYERIKSLGDSDVRRWRALYEDELPDALGRVSIMKSLPYENCAELVYAGIKHFYSNQTTWEWIEKNSDEAIKQRITARSTGALNDMGITINNSDELDQKIAKLPELRAFSDSKRTLSNYLRESIKALYGDHRLIHLRRVPTLTFSYFGDKWQEAIFGHVMIVSSKLKELWARTPVPSDIAVVYGFNHMAYVEDFLKDNDYQPQPQGEGWLTAAKICPSSDLGNEFIKTYVSADLRTELRLIGQAIPNDISPSDRYFIRDAILGEFKAQDGPLKKEYRPSNFEYVEESLLRLGYQLR